MKKQKRWSMLLTICLIISMLVIPVRSAQAAYLTSKFDTSYGTLPVNGGEAVATVAKKQVSNSKLRKSLIGYEWCAAFASDCAELAGQSAAVPASKIAATLRQNISNAGGTRVYTAQAGDYVFYYYGGRYCHVGIMIDSVNSVQGNMYTGNESYCVQTPYNEYRIDEYTTVKNGKVAYEFWRPNYRSYYTLRSSRTVSDGVYSLHTRLNSSKSLYVASNSKEANANINIYNYDKNNTANHWKITYQSNGYYKITNVNSGLALDVENGTNADSTNVQQYWSWDTDAQLWQIIPTSGGYYFVPKCATSRCLDVSGGCSSNGTNVQIYSANGTNSQIWSLTSESTSRTSITSCTASLSTTSYTYNGSVKTPSVSVKYGSKTLTSGTDYTVSYTSGRKYVGKYAVTITGKGSYTGSKTLYLYIFPKGTSLKSLTAASKAFTVKWTKQATQTSGYLIQYATNSSFTNAKTITVSSAGTTSKKISSLTAKKRYYVRIRTYKTVSGTKYCSDWSSVKYVTTK